MREGNLLRFRDGLKYITYDSLIFLQMSGELELRNILNCLVSALLWPQKFIDDFLSTFYDSIFDSVALTLLPTYIHTI